MIRWWRDLSVSKKLYAVVGVLALLIATELFTLLFAMDVLSAVRSFVGGEGLWSKGQKNAVYSLHRFASTGNPKFFKDYERGLAIPHGDHEARLAMTSAVFDTQGATVGFERGAIDPADVPGLVKMIRRFYWVPYIRESLRIWGQADDLLMEMEAAGRRVKSAVSDTGLASPEIEAALNEVDEINDRLTVLEIEFSNVLGQGSRWLEKLLMIILVCAVLTVESTGLFLTVSFSRNLNRALTDLMGTAREVGLGNFAVRAAVRSRDELGQLAEAINKMAADLQTSAGARMQAENASQTKSKFLANMSHEIRTPLGVILGLSEILRDPHLTRGEYLRYVDTIERTGKSLKRILNDILDLSKVEADKLDIENSRFAVAEFIIELKSMLSVEAHRSGNLFEIHTGGMPAEIVTDRTRLRQILVNLVNNSFKYTQNGLVELSMWMESRQMVFEIRDTGRGISPENQINLFEAFTRSDGVAAAEGTGLGLTISKRLAQALGGDVSLVTSEVGKGSTFRAEIRPLEIGEAHHVQASGPVEPVALNGRRVLVVEDSEDNQLLVKLLLSKQGMHVDFASNGQEAVDCVAGGRYDFVLMDMQMPVMDGYAATRQLRQMGFRGPIVALTAHAMKEDRDRCLDAGCDDYLTKPIDSRALFAAMARLKEKTAPVSLL